MWSELINTMSFLPLASSSKDGLPIGLSIERSTVSSSDSGLWKFSAFDSNKPAKFSSGIFATIVFLSYGNLISTIIAISFINTDTYSIILFKKRCASIDVNKC